jgi:ParB/RepB/Spo0J family partition protein
MGDVDKLQEAEEWAGQREQDERQAEQEAREAELAAAPVEDTASRKRGVRMIPIDEIADRDALRLDMPKVHQLALSIRQRGLVRALTVRPDTEGEGYIVVCGHRQLAALRELHGATSSVKVPCTVIEDLTEDELFALMLTDNEQKEDLEPLQAARAARRVLDLRPELTAAELAQSLGLKPAWLTNRFKLLDLPKTVQDHLEKGNLSFTVANMLHTANDKGKIDKDEVEELARQIAEGERTYTDVRREINPPKNPTPGLDATVAPRTVRVGDADELLSFAGGSDNPFDESGRAKKDTWDRTTWEAEELRAQEARGKYLEEEADRLLREAPIAMTGSLPTQRPAAGEFVDTVAREETPGAEGDLLGDQQPAEVTQVRDQLHAMMFGRMLRDWADDDYLTSLGVDRDDAMRFAADTPYSKRVYLFYNLAAHVGIGS